MSKPNKKILYKQIRQRPLRALCQVARTGSISLAAERLFLSQPTVTLQIQALEREMDTPLLERRGPRVALTPAGEVLYRLAEPLVDGMDRLKETFLAEYNRIESGSLDIAAGESTILYILPEPMKRFAETYPGIRLRLHNVTGRDGMAMLRADEADLAVGSMVDVPDDVIYRPSMEYSPALITPLEHPLAEKPRVTLEEISEHGLILPPRHLATWRMVEMVFEQHGLKIKVSLEAGGWEVIKKYVELGMGISIVTGVCLTNQERIAVKPLSEFFNNRSYGVVVRKGKFLSPQARLFIDMIDPGFAEEAG